MKNKKRIIMPILSCLCASLVVGGINNICGASAAIADEGAKYCEITQSIYDYVLVGEQNGQTECKDINYYSTDVNPYAMVSKYQFTKEGLGATDKVFDISFSVQRTTERVRCSENSGLHLAWRRRKKRLRLQEQTVCCLIALRQAYMKETDRRQRGFLLPKRSTKKLKSIQVWHILFLFVLLVMRTGNWNFTADGTLLIL